MERGGGGGMAHMMCVCVCVCTFRRWLAYAYGAGVSGNDTIRINAHHWLEARANMTYPRACPSSTRAHMPLSRSSTPHSYIPVLLRAVSKHTACVCKRDMPITHANLSLSLE